MLVWKYSRKAAGMEWIKPVFGVSSFNLCLPSCLIQLFFFFFFFFRLLCFSYQVVQSLGHYDHSLRLLQSLSVNIKHAAANFISQVQTVQYSRRHKITQTLAKYRNLNFYCNAAPVNIRVTV